MAGSGIGTGSAGIAQGCWCGCSVSRVGDVTTGSQMLQLSHLMLPQPSDSGGDDPSRSCTAGHGLVGSWQGLSSLSGEWVMVQRVLHDLWSVDPPGTPCQPVLCWHKRFPNHKGSKNHIAEHPSLESAFPSLFLAWVCFAGSWGWRQESTGSHAGRGNPACCCYWGGQRGADQPARMRAVELSVFAISCVSAAFP